MRAALLAGAARLAGSVWAQPLTLDQAVERAIAASPELRAGEAGVDAARAGQLQARVRPNPTVSVDMENGVGTGATACFGNWNFTAPFRRRSNAAESRTAGWGFTKGGFVQPRGRGGSFGPL